MFFFRYGPTLQKPDQPSKYKNSAKKIALENVKAKPHPPVISANFGLTILSILFLLGCALLLIPRPAQYHPHARFETGALQIEFLLHGQLDQAQCRRTVAALSNALRANCPSCIELTQDCPQSLDSHQRRLLSDRPIDTYSARMNHGVIAYWGPPSEAQDACKASLRENDHSNLPLRWSCYAPGESRTLSETERDRARVGFSLFSVLLYGITFSLVTLIAITFRAYRKQRRWWVEHENQGTLLAASHPTHPLLQKALLAGADTLILTGIFLALAWPATEDLLRWSHIDRKLLLVQGFVVLLTIGWFWVLLEHYSRRRPFWDEMREILRVMSMMFVVSIALAFVAEIDASRLHLLLAGLLNLLLIPLGRAGTRALLDELGLWKVPAVIVGTGANARDAWRVLRAEKSMGYQIIGLIEPEISKQVPTAHFQDLTHNLLVYPIAKLKELPPQTQIVVALESLSEPASQHLVRTLLLQQRNQVHLIPSLRGLPLHGTEITYFFSQEILLLSARNNLSRRSYRWLKRIIDASFATIILFIIFPLIAYLAWRIWREDGFPYLFKQTRLGQDGNKFELLKFRSMRRDAPEIMRYWEKNKTAEWHEYVTNNFKLINDPRVLKCGKWLRAYSLDELPQLINVIKGEMSLVGPRPLLQSEVESYGTSISYYLQVKPGITGLWQVSGRSNTTFQQRALMDEWYVRNWSLWHDIAILIKTIDVVLNRRGSY